MVAGKTVNLLPMARVVRLHHCPHMETVVLIGLARQVVVLKEGVRVPSVSHGGNMKSGRPSMKKAPEYSLRAYLESDKFKEHQKKYEDIIIYFKLEIFKCFGIPRSYFRDEK